ncbi:uncharacterized protein N7511_010163 [Penicillium nucicola]|uniref:uncharacterized protein n=1 Tax=Penicillium nucicola TaxID=1850975 RepID=UPI002544D44F|nr:uncharacterized protein N7511_010163 [Penicillium nucicola]KAJ5748467.1 hypothetical protein N7511_010163 [Penicillium nucicola]
MTSLSSQPRYIYKIVPSTAPVREPIPERLAVSDLDQDSGYIHLSQAHQVPNTLKTFFTEEPLVYVLRIEYHRVIQDIKWESPDGKVSGLRPGEGLFPHLYNGLRLGREEVESVAIWQNDEGWDKALTGAKPWLLC